MSSPVCKKIKTAACYIFIGKQKSFNFLLNI